MVVVTPTVLVLDRDFPAVAGFGKDVERPVSWSVGWEPLEVFVMRRLPILVVLAVVATLMVSASLPAHAEADVTTGEFTLWVNNPCALDGAGESIFVTGTWLRKSMYHTTDNVRLYSELRISHGTGFGAITGDKYIYSVNRHPDPWVDHEMNGQVLELSLTRTSIVGPGSGNDYIRTDKVLSVENAAGELVVSSQDGRTVCP